MKKNKVKCLYIKRYNEKIYLYNKWLENKKSIFISKIAY